MARRAAEPVRMCIRCSEVEGVSSFLTGARAGTRELVCPRCFYLGDIAVLSSLLPQSDATREVLLEGLQTLYELIRSRLLGIESERLAEVSSREGRP